MFADFPNRARAIFVLQVFLLGSEETGLTTSPARSHAERHRRTQQVRVRRQRATKTGQLPRFTISMRASPWGCVAADCANALSTLSFFASWRPCVRFLKCGDRFARIRRFGQICFSRSHKGTEIYENEMEPSVIGSPCLCGSVRTPESNGESESTAPLSPSVSVLPAFLIQNNSTSRFLSRHLPPQIP